MKKFEQRYVKITSEYNYSKLNTTMISVKHSF